MSNIRYLSIAEDGEEDDLEVTELPIEWDEEGDGWLMFIPHVVRGARIGGIAVDITVSTAGVLQGMGADMQFSTPDEAKRFAEATFTLQKGGDDENT